MNELCDWSMARDSLDRCSLREGGDRSKPLWQSGGRTVLPSDLRSVSRHYRRWMLKPGDRIPSARALTKELGLARGTIETAYSLLAAEGYIEARGQAGTIVSPHLEQRTPLACPVSLPDPRIDAVSFRPDSILPFQMGLPALNAFPRKIWARLGARSVRAMQPSDMIHPSVYGLPSLRAEIARYLQVSRGGGAQFGGALQNFPQVAGLHGGAAELPE
ncbi:GntR family transcriptional regulator [Bradyrhizobium barranii]|uniref:GntR family transcriptional regulator n=2 Tax=Bradyrhizobium TaxID=374 RepID=UPI0031FCC704